MNISKVYKKQLSFINLSIFDKNITNFRGEWNFINTDLKKLKFEKINFDREIVKNNFVTF